MRTAQPALNEFISLRGVLLCRFALVVPDIAEHEIADIGEHDGGLVMWCHVAGVENVVVREVALVGG